MTHRIRILLTLVTILSLCAPFHVEADVRIATIDINRVMNEIPAASAERERLDKKTATLQAEMKKRKQALEQFRATIDETNPSGDDVRKFNRKKTDLARFAKDNDAELKAEFVEVNKKLLAEAMAAVKQYSKAKGIDLVLEKGELSRGPVLYAAKPADITDNVIRSFNE